MFERRQRYREPQQRSAPRNAMLRAVSMRRGPARSSRRALSVATVVAVAAFACVLAIPRPATAAAPDLRVSANRLIDASTGATFVPRGINWPSFEYACYWGYGYSNERSATSVGPDEQDAADIGRWRVNTVRIPLNQDCWLGDDGLPHSDGVQLTASGYRRAVHRWVALLHAQGLAVILDLHWGSGPDVNWQTRTDEGQKAMADQRSDDFWASVAGSFRDDPSVMFDVFNEPYSRSSEGNALVFDLTWECWRVGGCQAPVENDDAVKLSGRTFTTAGMQMLVDAIRGAGATQPILLAGRDYANDVREWLSSRPTDGQPATTADDQLVASFHTYPGQACDAVECWDREVASLATTVPVVTTEFGQDDCRDDQVTRYMDWADEHGIGYLMWQWVLPDGPVVCGEDSAYSLIADPDGTPRAPLGTALEAHLRGL
jgi:endoglucanase